MQTDILKNCKQIVKCPHCGYEMHISEVFMPGEILGKPANVIRDPSGKIIYIEWSEEPEFTEHYTCDNCEKPFKITVSATAKSAPEDESLDFSSEASLL